MNKLYSIYSGDKKSDASVLRHVEEAEKIDSDAIGPIMEREVKRMEDNIMDWHLGGVEDHAVQRFCARIFKKLRSLGFLVSVDHAVFKQELDFINVMEMQVGTDDENGDGLSRTEINRRAEKMLHSVIDWGSINGRLVSDISGQSWQIMDEGDNSTANEEAGAREELLVDEG